MTVSAPTTSDLTTMAQGILDRLEAAWNGARRRRVRRAVQRPTPTSSAIRGDLYTGREAIAEGHQAILESVYAGSTARLPGTAGAPARRPGGPGARPDDRRLAVRAAGPVSTPRPPPSSWSSATAATRSPPSTTPWSPTTTGLHGLTRAAGSRRERTARSAGQRRRRRCRLPNVGVMSSPAERYAAARRRTAHPALADFTSELGFSLDPFQVEACEALDEGAGVLVCAPTGAGKTVVGEFAIHKALAEGRKAFYTTPIKALSNQKYADLVERYGAGQGRPAHRRQRRQRGRPRGRDDDRGAAQHALRRVPGDRRPRLRGHGRGALPRRPLPRRGVGGGDHPPPAVGHPGLAVGDGEQRRGVRRLAGHRPRPHEGRRQRGAPDPAVAAHAGRQPGVRPVLPPPRRARRRARRAAAGALDPGARQLGGRPRAGPVRARVRAADRQLGRRGQRRTTGPGPRLAQAALQAAVAPRRRRAPGPRRPPARRSPSSSAGTAATPR